MILLATPAGAADLCEDVAAPIRQGKLDVINRKGWSLNGSLLDGLAGVRPQLIKLNRDEVNDTVPAPFPRPQGTGVIYEPLGGSGIVAIGSVGGAMHCQNFKFFERKGKGVASFPAPAMLPDHHELCWNEWGRTGTVSGIPVNFVENEAQKYRRSISFTPLQDRKWGKQCRITVTYRPDLRISASSCKAGTCPSQLGDLATQIARRYENKLAQPVEIRGAEAKVIRELLEDSDRILPSFRDDFSNGYLTFGKDSRMIPLKLNGRLSIAMVGSGWWGWRNYPGLLVGFWQVEKDQLVPVAGFQIGYAQNKVTRVSVSH